VVGQLVAGGDRFRSEHQRAPGTNSRGLRQLADAMRGPCKSTSTAIGSPCASAACRTSLIQPPRISGVPCER